MDTHDKGDDVYRLKVTLRGLQPPIWRRFLVPGQLSLRHLHLALQVVMGWTNSHLHRFECGGTYYGEPDPDYGIHQEDEATARLDALLRKPGDHLMYEYDFGDCWEHDVVLEAVLPAGQADHHPAVEGGQRACPPEDVGGPPGYQDFLSILADPCRAKDEEMLSWLGGDFDSERFDPERLNAVIEQAWRNV